MARPRHSYELKIYIVDPNNVKAPAIRYQADLPNAEGFTLDKTLASARELVGTIEGYTIRSLNVSEQRKPRSKGPTTGSIVVYLIETIATSNAKSMKLSRLNRGLPKGVKR